MWLNLVFYSDHSINTIFCGLTNTLNQLFVVVQSVIKDMCCGSHKYTQTLARISGVCALHVHKWTLACTCASTTVFMRGFCKRDREGGEVTAGHSFTAQTHRFVDASPPRSRRKQLELSPLRCAIFGLKPPGGRRGV